MIRLLNTLFPKSLLVAAAGAGMILSTIGDASACDGKRGSIARILYGSAYGSHHVQRPVQPCYQQPHYQQQLVQQPQFQQQQMPPQVQQLMPQGQQVQIQGQQTLQGQPMIQQGQPVVPQGQQFQQGVAQQGVAQQQVQSSAVAMQNAGVAAPIGGDSSAAASVSAIGALGGSAPATTSIQSQAIANVPSQNLAAPAQTNDAASANGSAVANAPAAGNATQAPAASAEQNAMESALQALMGDASAAAQPVTAAPITAPTGEFSATISNGSTIRLSLRADGSFLWLANKAGKPSNFQGTFSVNGGSLTLLRGSDNQKLAGSFALTQNGFKLRLVGQNNQNSDELNFVRG